MMRLPNVPTQSRRPSMCGVSRFCTAGSSRLLLSLSEACCAKLFGAQLSAPAIALDPELKMLVPF